MALERVSILEGKSNVMVIAPHGAPGDDLNTDIIAEKVAKTLRCYAVINRGWQRAGSVDELDDKADCNNVNHMIGVVKDEFLDPVLRFKSRMIKNYGAAFVFMIHGMSNAARTNIGNSNLDIVLGYGAGAPPSYSCDVWRKDLFSYLLDQAGLNVWEGKAGGQLSGWSRNNMNQLFRKHYLDTRVQSMQLEIVRDLREDATISELTSEYLSAAINDLVNHKNWCKPSNYMINQY